MDPAQGNEVIQQFQKLLEENGRQEQAADLSALLWYMDGMTRQYEAVLQEVQALRQQLAQEKRPTVKEAIQDAVSKMEGKVQQGRTALADLWEKITRCAADAVRNFKEMGVSALDKAVSALGVKRTLEALQEGISGLAADARKNIEKVENMGQNLRRAGGHVKNAELALTGKEAQVVDGGQEGRFQSAVLAPMRGIQKLLSNMSNATLAAIGSAEHLEQKADTVRAVRTERRAVQKPSIRRDLAAKRAKANAVVAIAPERFRKPPKTVR